MKHTNSEQELGNWEKKLLDVDKTLQEYGHNDCPICGINYTRLKTFISNLIQSEREKVLREIVSNNIAQSFGNKHEYDEDGIVRDVFKKLARLAQKEESK